MSHIRIDLDWARLLGFNHADKGAIASAAKVGEKNQKPMGASADLCIAGLGAKIGSKQWVRLTD